MQDFIHIVKGDETIFKRKGPRTKAPFTSHHPLPPKRSFIKSCKKLRVNKKLRIKNNKDDTSLFLPDFLSFFQSIVKKKQQIKNSGEKRR